MKKACYYKNLSHADLERVMDICERLHQAKPRESFLRHSYRSLNQALESMRFSTAVYNFKPFRLMEQKINTPEYEHWVEVFKKHVLDHPDHRFFIATIESGRDMMPLKFAAKEFHYSCLCTELYNKLHKGPCQLWLGIQDDNELLICIYTYESECSEERLAMICLIQSYLESAWINWKRVSILEKKMNLVKNSAFQSDEEKAVGAQIREALGSLTERQRDVVKQVALGKDNQQVAEELGISVLTVKTHLKTIFQSLDVQHRTELAAKWHVAYFVHLPT